MEWLNLSVRWIHMITGVAWIGASFYFVWLENNLNRANPKEGLAGDLWAIHGGGIYHLEKYKLAPPTMPENLHWFKWEAYFTWMSGIALLCLVFYFNRSSCHRYRFIDCRLVCLRLSMRLRLGQTPGVARFRPVCVAGCSSVRPEQGVQRARCVPACGRHYRHHHGR
jgi:hypothetical protein